MQLLLICGGRGSRFPGRPGGVPKSMLPLGGEALAERLLRQLAPYHDARLPVLAVAAAGDPHVPARLGGRARVIAQERPDGVAAAIALALPWLEDDALVALGDVVLDGVLGEPPPEAPALVVWPDAPARVTSANFGVRVAGGGVAAVVEKPGDAGGLVCGLGVYLFTRRVIAGFAESAPDARGERAITDALASAIAGGERFGLWPFAGGYVNVNSPEDLAEAEDLIA